MVLLWAALGGRKPCGTDILPVRTPESVNPKGVSAMFTNLSRTVRKALLGAILAGVTIFSIPTTGCDSAGVKDVSGTATRTSPNLGDVPIIIHILK
jgi:hypothetical protein